MSKSEVLPKITEAYESAPDAVVGYLDREMFGALKGAVLRIAMLNRKGPTLKPGDVPTVTESFKIAVELERKQFPGAKSQFTATLEQIGEDIAAQVDASLKRVVLTDPEFSHDAYLDIQEGHAKLMRGLCSLTHIPKAKEQDNG